MNKRAECVRTVANWSINDAAFAYDHATFDKNKMAELMPVASPKMNALFDKIEQLDAADLKEHGHKFKHMVFTDLKSSAFGAKLLAAGFTAKGYTAAYGRDLEINENKLRALSDNNTFAVLCSTVIYGKPLGVRFRRRILDVFNKRPENVHGELIRFIILDQGFKEGIDLYDIKYIHLFEPLITAADEKQAVGRGTRLCGQKGLAFDQHRGWPLHVIRYEVSIPDDLQHKYHTTRMFDLYLQESGIDLRKLVFSSTLEDMAIYGAVDHDLTRAVHEFNIHEHDEPSSRGLASLFGLLSGGVRKKKHNKNRVNVARNKKGFSALREYITQRFATKDSKYVWPKAKLENQCVTHGGASIVDFNPTQEFVRMFFQPQSSYKGMLLWHSTGTGKCHARDTPIVMYDGSVKMVQDIVVGDMLMGDDSTPRRVLSLATGNDDMYTVTPLDGNGDPYIVNSEHILCLKREDSHVVEMTVTDYCKLSDSEKISLYGYRSDSVEFQDSGNVRTLDPYIIGFWLGETSEMAHVPFQLRVGDRDTRFQLLAGFVDSAGEATVDGKGYIIRLGNGELAGDVAFVARSLGLLARIDCDSGGAVVVIGGRDAYLIPVKAINPIEYYADDLCTPISVRYAGRGEYFGFTLDGNNRYLLGDFTVTHNTCTAVATATTSWERHGYTILWVTRHTLKPDIWKNMYQQVCSLVLRDRAKRGEIPPDAVKTPMKFVSKMWVAPMSYKQFSNMLAGKNDMYHEMVKRNGQDDILRKTFIIIDEAHKLFANDVPTAERPDVAGIYKGILDSYEKSGKDSARVLLMTATPYTADPMDMIKLMNLMRPRAEALPEEFVDFAGMYLDQGGKFSQQGTMRFLNDIAGYISYLNREKDARQFSYPVYENVIVPMTRSERGMKQEELAIVEKESKELDANVKRGEEAIKLAKKQARDDKAKMNKGCDKLKTNVAKKACKDEVATKMTEFERELLADLHNRVGDDKDRISVLKKRARELQKSLKDKKADYSQEAALDVRCGYKAKP